MRLVMKGNRVYAPNDIGGMVTGLTRTALKQVRDPQWQESRLLTEGFVAEFDGVSNVIDNAITRLPDASAVVSYVDGVRFVKQLGDDLNLQVRRPSMPNQINTKLGELYTCMPIATEMDATEIKLGDALSASGFTFQANDFFKFPFYKYVFRRLEIRQLFGADAEPFFNFANRITRQGPVELFLTALQPDAELKTLSALSGQTPMRDVVTSDELSVLLEALELNSMTAFQTLVTKANALQALRRCSVINGSDDVTGVGIMLYYAMMHPAYIARLPQDVVLAISQPGADGVAIVNGVGNVTVPALRIQIDESALALVPVLRTITGADLTALNKARILYKMICVMRLIQLRGIQPTLSYTLPEADRVKLFNLML